MSSVTLAVLPVFLLIFLGTFLFQRGWFGSDFWRDAERLTYFALFPALIVRTLATAELNWGEVLPMVLAIDGSILVVTMIALALRPLLKIGGPQTGAFVQGVVRMNTYVGLAVSFALFGEEGLAQAAVAVAAIVPLVNLLSVSVLVRWGEPRGGAGIGLWRLLATNPLILACVAGIGMNISGVGLPPILGPTLEILGRAALALGLLAVGAGLDPQAVRESGRLLGVSVVLKLLLLPALTWLGCLGLGVDGISLAVAVLFNALPTATSAYILARQLGGDHRLMAAIITAQTALSMLTIPLLMQSLV